MFRILPLLLLLLVPGFLLSQPGSIVADPQPVKLRLFWAMIGEPKEELGSRFGAIPDVSGDGIGEFLVAGGGARDWRCRLFYGGEQRPVEVESWSYDSALVLRPTIGKFWGDARRMLVLGRVEHTDRLARAWGVHLLSVDSGRVATTPTLRWPVGRVDRPELVPSLHDIRVADLDRDGADELILFNGWVEGDPYRRYTQIWIYRGGPDFQLDTPSVVLREPIEFDGYEVVGLVGDLDGDTHLDIATRQRYGNASKLNIWFGTGELPESGIPPDRAIDIPFSFRPQLVDADGDRVADVLVDKLLYLSSKGKGARTRSFTLDDVDFRVSELSYHAKAFGPMNNRSGRFDMVGTERFDPISGGALLLAFSGGPNGPDPQVDATFNTVDWGFLGPITSRPDGPAGDLTGDGWADFLCGNWEYWDPGVDKGVIAILAGGPYIPVDDPTMGVRRVETGEHRAALSVWPNPVRDVLRIAWRGDLRRPPTRFEVFDARGALVADGNVDPWLGSALWPCADAPPGLYVLRVFADDGAVLASTKFLKQREE